jgi:hypothetical protein
MGGSIGFGGRVVEANSGPEAGQRPEFVTIFAARPDFVAESGGHPAIPPEYPRDGR